MSNSIDLLRTQIDEIDDKIIKLLEKRLESIDKLALIKTTLTDESREEKILAKTQSDDISQIYKEIFRITKRRMAKKNPNRFA